MWRKPIDATRPAAPEPDAHPLPPPRFDVPAAAPAPRVAEGARITQAISIHGDISGTENLFIDGELQGSINLPESRVTVGANGRLKANVEAGEIVVEGQINGSLTAGARVIIRRTGRVYGSVLTARLVIEEGAVLNGQVDMAGSGEVAARRPSLVSSSVYRAATP